MAAELPTAKSQLYTPPASFVPFTSEQKELETAYQTARFWLVYGVTFCVFRDKLLSEMAVSVKIWDILEW